MGTVERWLSLFSSPPRAELKVKRKRRTHHLQGWRMGFAAGRSFATSCAHPANGAAGSRL